jgi:Family of unknown function (DUF6364)
MNTKLTLRMNDVLIAEAKAFAAENGRSLSQMVADYFAVLAMKRKASSKEKEQDDWEKTLNPLTKRLLGAAIPKDGATPATMDDYYAHLKAKHMGEGSTT